MYSTGEGGTGIALGGVGPAVISALGGVDAASLSVSDAVSWLARWEAQSGWMAARRAEVIHRLSALTPEPDPRDVALGMDSDEPHHWEREELMVACRIGPGEAGRRVRCAALLAEKLTETVKCLQAGSLSWEHAVSIAEETRELSPEQAAAVERAVLADGRLRTPWQFRRRARRLAAAMQPTLAITDAQDLFALRSVRTWITPEGMGALFARLPVEDLATVTAAIDELAVAGGADDERSAEQRRADALVDLCADRLVGGDGHVAIGAKLVVHVPYDTLRAAGTTIPTSDVASIGGPGIGTHENLDSHSLARISCDATIRRLVTDPVTGLTLDETRYQRVPSPAVRRAIGNRDQRRCTFPGCTRAVNLHMHHIRPWNQGGLSTPENLTSVCNRHHHAVHDA